ncbi:DUF6986 family protein [uncultured Jatrophihabitans sp.]|uniref:DUF6986 family protein n=1 Tax=uncultured Jatrophihabitans sp. TaxID=1610747 RepID=UPI0035CBF732
MLDPSLHDRLDALLADDDGRRARLYPATRLRRQPVHTVHVPADRFAGHTVAEWRSGALAALDEHGPMPGVDEALEARVRDKLADEPIEDLRIDFADGYGLRSDADEDAAARAAGTALGRGAQTPFVGLRIKSLEAATPHRAVCTLELFLEQLFAFGGLPAGFRVTVPAVTSVAQVEAMVELCAAFESELAIARVPFELQLDSPQAVVGADGTALLARMLHSGAGRCVGLTLDPAGFTAAAGGGPTDGSVADHARAVLVLATAGTGVPVSDGTAGMVPAGPRTQVHAAWSAHLALVRHALEAGFPQGRDVHPAQLPSRFAATFAFYADGLDAAARAVAPSGATSTVRVPASTRSSARFLLRGLRCGALDEPDVRERCGLGTAELDVLAIA